MNRFTLSALALCLTAAPALRAQEPHVGFGLNLGFPTGEFRNKDYPAIAPVDARWKAAQNESYDLGLGGQLTVSVPVDQMVAVRLNLNGMITNGTNTALSDPYYGDKQNLQHSIFCLGGDMQFFLNGSAARHRGTFLIAGVSADFERFDRSYGDPNYDTTTTDRKSRMGGNVGFGHSFGFAGARFNLEATFHKTLTGNGTGVNDFPSSDFARLSLGWVF